MRHGGNAPPSHSRGLGLVPGQSVRMCADEIALQQIFGRIFRFPPISTRKTPATAPYSFSSLQVHLTKDEKTKPGDNPITVVLFSHIGEQEECKVRGGADKSLARSGRKQATATKLGIYST